MHYYSDEQTQTIVDEAARVLAENGVFAFACKSYDDLHSSGQELAPNIFSYDNGVTIHLFSMDYARQLLLHQGFEISYLDEVNEEYNGRRSKIVRCIARKPPAPHLP
ncbi:MAG TPA: hypothetical protein VFW90_02945, partial [Candidatus Saccharimonadales bacterium]|nr:hypothetical protein [Candidatus Saccharimonadales bacterium]